MGTRKKLPLTNTLLLEELKKTTTRIPPGVTRAVSSRLTDRETSRDRHDASLPLSLSLSEAGLALNPPPGNSRHLSKWGRHCNSRLSCWSSSHNRGDKINLECPDAVRALFQFRGRSRSDIFNLDNKCPRNTKKKIIIMMMRPKNWQKSTINLIGCCCCLRLRVRETAPQHRVSHNGNVTRQSAFHLKSFRGFC